MFTSELCHFPLDGPSQCHSLTSHVSSVSRSRLTSLLTWISENFNNRLNVQLSVYWLLYAYVYRKYRALYGQLRLERLLRYDVTPCNMVKSVKYERYQYHNKTVETQT